MPLPGISPFCADIPDRDAVDPLLGGKYDWIIYSLEYSDFKVQKKTIRRPLMTLVAQ
jgi:hypothetical protein